MVSETLPLTTIGIIIIISIIFSIFVKKLGQNEVIGFIIAGFLLGPFGLGFLKPTDELVIGFAELGLFVLLFYLGIELSIKEFLASGFSIIGLALVDMILTTGLGVSVMLLLGYDLMFAIIVGIMLFCTSTAIVAKFILNNNLIENRAAKTSISILILQDFLGILLLVFVTSFSSKSSSVIDLVITAIVFAVASFYAIYHLSRIVEEWLKNNDFSHTEMTLYALGVGLITATLANLIGLSSTIGAYFAGFALSETESGNKIKKDVGFLRDFFLVFFFVGFGTTLFFDTEIGKVVIPELNKLIYIIVLAIGLSSLAILAHSISARVLGKVFNLTEDDSSLMAILLSPLGEFVVIIATVTAGILSTAEKSIIGPLAFLLIIVTLLIFQPLYKFRNIHKKIFAVLPQVKEPDLGKKIVIEKTSTIKNLQDFIINLIVVICFAKITIILYEKIPSLGIPITNSREITAVLIFTFFAAIPLRKTLKSLLLLTKEFEKTKHNTTNKENKKL
ncbi:MAG: cation:proton antiporter [Candidatus Diapherotrites archaeon]